MKFEEIDRLHELADDTAEIDAARERLEELVLRKNQSNRKKSQLQKQLDELFSKAVNSSEEDPEVYRKIEEVKGRMEIEEKTPEKIDEEIEKQRKKLKKLEWEHFQKVKKAFNPAVKPVIEQYLEVMKTIKTLEAEIERACQAKKKAAPTTNSRDRLRASLLTGSLPVDLPLHVSDKRISRFEKRLKEIV